MKKGILYIVPTPIGNLKDITLRAIEVLKQADIIGAEDTRTSGILLKHYEIKTPQQSYHKYNETKKSVQFIRELESGKNIALITDAGTPGISDPAAKLIKEAINQGIKIEVLPGATALIPAIVGSGLDTERFYFAGFLPEKSIRKQELLRELSRYQCSLIFYVSPHDLKDFVNDLLHVFGNRKIVFARELSKLHEEYIRSSLRAVSDGQEIMLRGEFVAVVEGYAPEIWDKEKLKKEISQLIEQGLDNKTLIKKLNQEKNIPVNKIKRILYK